MSQYVVGKLIEKCKVVTSYAGPGEEQFQEGGGFHDYFRLQRSSSIEFFRSVSDV